MAVALATAAGAAQFTVTEAFPAIDASRTLSAVRGALRSLLGHRLKKG